MKSLKSPINFSLLLFFIYIFLPLLSYQMPASAKLIIINKTDTDISFQQGINGTKIILPGVKRVKKWRGKSKQKFSSYTERYWGGHIDVLFFNSESSAKRWMDVYVPVEIDGSKNPEYQKGKDNYIMLLEKEKHLKEMEALAQKELTEVRRAEKAEKEKAKKKGPVDLKYLVTSGDGHEAGNPDIESAVAPMDVEGHPFTTGDELILEDFDGSELMSFKRPAPSLTQLVKQKTERFELCRRESAMVVVLKQQSADTIFDVLKAVNFASAGLRDEARARKADLEASKLGSESYRVDKKSLKNFLKDQLKAINEKQVLKNSKIKFKTIKDLKLIITNHGIGGFEIKKVEADEDEDED